MKKRRVLTVLLTAALAMNYMPAGAQEQELPAPVSEPAENISLTANAAVTSGECGENGGNLTWKVDSSGTLTISGSGNLAYYQSSREVPWYSFADEIAAVNLDITTEKLCSRGGAYVFGMLSKVQGIVIPEGVISIPESVDMFPRGLRKLRLPSTYTGNLSNNNLIRNMCHLDIEVAADNPVYCSVDGTLFSKDKTKLVQYTKSAIEPDYAVPDTVTDIDHAFYGNQYLRSLTISKNVRIVDKETQEGQFYSWGFGLSISAPACNAVYVDENNPYFCSVDGVLYNKDMSVLIWCPSGKTGRYEIPNSVKAIAAGAFQYSKISDVQIPDGLEILGRCAFNNSAITRAIIPPSVKSIYSGCFYNCMSLKSVEINANDVEMGAQVFDRCYELKTAGPMGSGCDIEFCWDKSIPQEAFDDAELEELTIPNSITAIGDYAFSYCSAKIWIDKPEGAISGAPWSADSTKITYLREMYIAPITQSYVYSGKAIRQKVDIVERKTDGSESRSLAEGKDYTLTYTNNRNAGTAKITVHYIGEYEKLANVVLTFTITPKPCVGLTITPIPNQACTGRAITPDPVITDENIL